MKLRERAAVPPGVPTASKGWIPGAGQQCCMSLQIGIDAWNLKSDRRGIGRYVREIVRRWISWGVDRVKPSLVIPEWATFFARRRYVREIGLDVPVRRRNDERGLDIIWYPWNGMSWVAATPAVATLHDASLFDAPPVDPAVCEREQRPFRIAADRARRIITDSQFSQTELARYLRIDPARIEVVRLGIDEIFAPAAEGAPSPTRYLLFVGEPEARKGLPVLLAALARVPGELLASLELVVAGAGGGYSMPPIPDSVRLRNVGWVDDVRLAGLYRGAAALVYPSSYEGFGLPILEAMASGTPVIASDIASLREAGGEAALYVETGSAEALCGAIQAVLVRPDLAARMRRLGLDNARERTWDRTAQETLAVIERALTT